MGIRFKTTINRNETIAMWKNFINEIPSPLLSNNRYGIFEAGDICSPNIFNFDSETQAFIGVEIPENYPVPKNRLIKNLQGGKYAKFIHKDRVDTLIQTYQYIWGV